VIVREPGSPQPGSYLAFLVRIQLSTPRHLKCQIPRQTKPGFFWREVRRKSASALSVIRRYTPFCPLSEGKPDIGIVEHNDRLWLLSGLSRAIYPGPIYEFAVSRPTMGASESYCLHYLEYMACPNADSRWSISHTRARLVIFASTKPGILIRCHTLWPTPRQGVSLSQNNGTPPSIFRPPEALSEVEVTEA
jgi:hypothetical protein